jgi:hypothetical protein
MTKHKGYWKQFNLASKKMSPQEVFKVAESHVARLPPPWSKSKRGRPYKREPRQYASLLATSRLFDWSSREAEANSECLLNQSVDHASVAWALAKTHSGYFEALLWRLYQALTSALTQFFHSTDSTGVRTDRKRFATRVFSFGKEIEDLKLHCLASWMPTRHAIALASAACTRGERNDSPIARELLNKTSLPPGKFFGDLAYDAEETFELAFEKRLTPVIKRRVNTRRGFFRKKAAKHWSKRAYAKYRSRIETVFAGSQARNHNRVRERLVATRRRAVQLLAVAHNLRTAIRLGTQVIETFIRQLGRWTNI